ncbi:MAG: chorismate mutase [Spirochaetales bacterium]|nr:chorismate mutase [Spirochaetales bacterium]
MSEAHDLPVFGIDLEAIALRLEGLEETIIHHLIERAQYRLNAAVYEPGKSGFAGFERESLLDVRLLYSERMDAEFGRFCVPEERPFNADLPAPRRPVNLPVYPLALSDFDAVNLTAEIRRSYIEFLPAFTPPGDDGQYGSAIEHDVFALQAIARRVHYGSLFVAESKYREDPAGYGALAKANEREAIIAKLTRKEVEERIIARVKEKVAAAQATANRRVRSLVDPEAVVRFYRDTVIPLTKEGEVRYLLNRKAI